MFTKTTVSSLHKLGSVTVTVYDPVHKPLAISVVLITFEVELSTQENWYGVPFPPEGKDSTIPSQSPKQLTSVTTTLG